MGNFSILKLEEISLALEDHSLAGQFNQLHISTTHRVLALVEARSTLIDQIRSDQFEDVKLKVIQD